MGNMRLLILTQKVDINDDVLGFFHGWIEKLAKRCESIIVVCLQKGEYKLPENVVVFSLGKEREKSRLKYLMNFYKYIWRERKNYDAVFAHMNQEYVLLGGLFWKIFGKKIFMWRNHKKGGILTRIAVMFSDKVFCTSKFSFTAKFKKTKIMPIGVDMGRFVPNNAQQITRNNVLFLGRISPIKNIHILVKAADELDRTGVDFILNIVGEPPERDKEYYKKIREMAKNLENKGKIKFIGKVPNYKINEIYAQNGIFINLTKSGSMDKTIIEAMACGLAILVCNKSFEGILPKEFIFEEDSATNLAKKIEYALKMPHNEKSALALKLRKLVEENHSLDLLVQKLIYEFQG